MHKVKYRIKSIACLYLLIFARGSIKASALDTPPNPKEKVGWELVMSEEFNDPVLDPTKFSNSYLPHWTTYDQSLAHYDVTSGILSLKIEKDGQGPWWHGSNIQKVPVSRQG